MTDKDFSMQPSENGDKFPTFSMRKSKIRKSPSILELFKLEEWIQLIKKFLRFPIDPGPE